MSRILPLLLLFFCLVFCLSIFGQDNASEYIGPEIHIKKTNQKIILDGVLDEGAWNIDNTQSPFWQYFPLDSVSANGQTEIYMTYDDQHLYVAVKCYSSGSDFITPSLRRDYSFRGNDNISILFDTYSDATNAFLFGLNPYGVRREALISNGGRGFRDFSGSWDNKWRGNSKSYEDYWVGEFAIPFKTIRYKEGAMEWRFNAYRNDTQLSEYSTWSNIPRNRIVMDLTYMGKIIWDEPLKKPGTNFAVIPYVSGASARDFEGEPNGKPSSDFAVGGDAKIGVTAGLNLDLTVNPDFSQVEVDRQVTNLDRFEIFFPERRQFFLENADLFGSFGHPRVNPFFSRRIGVAQDTATGQNIQNTILFGSRLSGKINDRARVGLLNMQTAKQVGNDLPGINYTVAALEKTVFSRSQIVGIFVNQQSINPSNFSGELPAYNRVGGLEYRLATADNRWSGKLSYQRSFTADNSSGNAQYFSLNYEVPQFRVALDQYIVSEDFDAKVGFVQRQDILYLNPEGFINFFASEKSKVNRHRIGFNSRIFYKLGEDDNEVIRDFGLWEWEGRLFYEARFKNTTSIEARLQYKDVTLLGDFDPTRVQEETVFLAAGERFKYTSMELSYRSDVRKAFSYRVNANFGQFFNGSILGLRGRFNYRFQPFGQFGLEYGYNRIVLDDPFKPANLWLVGPRFDLTFTKSLFLTTLVQYNSQLDNMNINARFQWRYAPVSDFFLVYTDNYLTNPWDQFGARNRSIVAKVTYWLNL